MTLFKPKQSEDSAPSSELDFLLRERISNQWSGFLQALSSELLSQLSPQECRDFLRSVGTRLATSLAIPTQDTVPELQAAINEKLLPLRWGRVELIDTGSHLQVRHHYCPLPLALGVDGHVAGGVLEGMYEHWFRSAGAEQGLTTVQTGASADGSVLDFKFGQN